MLKTPIVAHFERLFWGLIPSRSQILSRPSTASSLAENTHFRTTRSVRKCDLQASDEKTQQQKKIEKNEI